MHKDFVVIAPRYAGDVPDGGFVIEATTPWVWIIGRTQTNGVDDYAAVNAVQDGYTITPLQSTEYEIDPDQDMTVEPLRFVNSMSAVEFFTYACDALMVNPPHASDFSILARIASLGIVPGQPFNARALDTTDVKAGATAAKEAIAAAVPRLGTQANGWTIVRETIGVYGNAYLQRAAVTLAGLGANPPEDAIYPLLVTDAGGDATTGDKDYVIHFDADKLLPVDAFWSTTMYDAEGYQVPKRAHKAEMRAKHQA